MNRKKIGGKVSIKTAESYNDDNRPTLSSLIHVFMCWSQWIQKCLQPLKYQENSFRRSYSLLKARGTKTCVWERMRVWPPRENPNTQISNCHVLQNKKWQGVLLLKYTEEHSNEAVESWTTCFQSMIHGLKALFHEQIY